MVSGVGQPGLLQHELHRQGSQPWQVTKVSSGKSYITRSMRSPSRGFWGLAMTSTRGNSTTLGPVRHLTFLLPYLPY